MTQSGATDIEVRLSNEDVIGLIECVLFKGEAELDARRWGERAALKLIGEAKARGLELPGMQVVQR